LGLFDEAAAMEKFQAWHNEHEANISRRSDAHKSSPRAKKAYVPVVKKVEAVAEVPVEAPVEAPTEAPTDASSDAPAEA
jgi:small subunit ribosomal protein S16